MEVASSPLTMLNGQLRRAFRSRILLSTVLGIAVWEVSAAFINPLFFAPFSAVLKSLWQLGASGELWVHTSVTLLELILGFTLGSILGLLGGTLAALNRPFRDLSDPWVSFIYSAPYVAFIPLLVLWLGIGLAPKVAITVIAVFIPVWLNTTVGIAGTEPLLVEVARSFNASKMQIVRLVMFRSALPIILTGLRVAFSRGLIAVVVAEFIASTAGLGFLIERAGSFFDAPRLLAGVTVLAVFTIAMTELLKWVERKLAPWGLRQ
jgi:ABC-type nitrate/sulfonate/bicarbonate transport system permease component